MTITFEIETANDAFMGRPQTEAKRIMKRWLATHILLGGDTSKLMDINGNTVGTVTVKGK